MKRILLILFCACVVLSFSYALVLADVDEDFSSDGYMDNGWQQFVLLGNPDGKFIFPERRRMSFHLPDYDSYIYMTNENANTNDITVEGTFENIYSSNASYGLVCRWHDYGWYELRVFVAGPQAGSYAMYKYDAYLKTQGKVPFVVLHPGMDRINTYDIKLGMNKKNKLKLICSGDEFRIFINDEEEKPVSGGKLSDIDFEDGTAGFLVHGYSGGPAQIDMTRFKAYVPEE